jgi:ADP-heptose:LPS heptosyltransferase
VAVIRLRSLGDCVLTTPALEILKQARPDVAVAVVVENRFAPVFEHNSDVQRILTPGAATLRQWNPDLAINLHGGPTSAALIALSGAKLRAGFSHFRFRFIYNVRIPKAQEILEVCRTVHTAEHLASAMFYLGAPRIPVPRAKLAAEPAPERPPYAVIHPMATAAGKTWPAEKFLRVAERLRSSLHLESVFIGGPQEDLSSFAPHEIVCGAPLAHIKSLLQTASIFIGNDSGPAHMAAAFGIPVVVVFGASDAAVWSPWQTPCAVLQGTGRVASISVDEVMAAVSGLGVRA